MVLIRTLVSWAGLRFEVQPGELVEVDEATAAARILAGLAEPAEAINGTASPSPRRRATQETGNNG